MLSFLLSVCLSTAPSSTPAGGKVPPVLPLLAKAPLVDGALADLSPTHEFQLAPSPAGATASLKLKAALHNNTLFIGAAIKDDRLLDGDSLDLTLYFPGSGTTSQGVLYRFGPASPLPSPDGLAARPFAQALVRSASQRHTKGFTVELAIPPRALPRFQAHGPLALEVCAEYSDVASPEGEAPRGEATKLTNCPNGVMLGGAIRIPEQLRTSLRLAPPSTIEGLEPRESGWVGFSRLHSPSWVFADAPLTPASLSSLVAEGAAIDAQSAALAIPVQLELPDHRPLFIVLSGKNPFAAPSGCLEGAEVRMAMYAIDGRTALGVLEWPASNCGLGRAMRVELTPEGSLSIGYTHGASIHFTWSGDHFERSELGLRQ